ncbi:MAG: hypothetical protein HN348_30010, partial [Proteobacteria bacterium]|nr:hypothetical protein [Pseudomonadota bacterium]
MATEANGAMMPEGQSKSDATGEKEPLEVGFSSMSRSRISVHLLVLIACMTVAVVHQLIGGLGGWYIEDAAISFAYSQNFAAGEGLVPFAGGERIEGYS